MDGDSLGNLIYLVLLGSAVIFWFVTNHQQSFRRSIQQGLAWLLLLVGVIAAYGMWGDIRSTVTLQAKVDAVSGRVEIPQSPDGHYRLTLEVNGAPVGFIVDTGASEIVLSQSDAQRAGFDLSGLAYYGRAYTANGQVRTAPVTIQEIRLGAMVDNAVPASVNGGALDQSLLGMSYLQRFSEIRISGGTLTLLR